MTDHHQTFRVSVVKILTLTPHPNAQFLSIASGSGWSCVVRTEDFLKQDFAIFVPVDSVADEDHPLFRFLKGKPLKEIDIRGVFSNGLLLNISKVEKYCLNHLKLQEKTFNSLLWGKDKYDFAPMLKIRRYQDLRRRKESLVFSPNIRNFTKYGSTKHLRDLHHNFFQYGLVYITEKLHGVSARYGLINGKFVIGSRNMVISQNSNSSWLSAAIEGDIKNKLERFQSKISNSSSNIIFYGEIVGKGIQDLDYGYESPTFFLYDVTVDDIPVNCSKIILTARLLNIRFVPILFYDSLEPTTVSILSSGPSTLPSARNKREGIVLRLASNFKGQPTSQIVAKVISPEFLRRKGGIDNSQD
jgi:RNA ligase (TIGR02306 family)